MQELEQIDCSRCGNKMPKLRLTQYGYNFCVKCSTVRKKVGRTITYGQGDHTYNELQVLDQEIAIKLESIERGISVDRLQIEAEDEEPINISQSASKVIDRAIENADIEEQNTIYKEVI